MVIIVVKRHCQGVRRLRLGGSILTDDLCLNAMPTLAEAVVEDIWIYTLSEWSLAQANSYIDDVIDAFEGLTASTSSPGGSDGRSLWGWSGRNVMSINPDLDDMTHRICRSYRDVTRTCR